ncbi:phage major capsid protein, P2 family [Pseudomonas aeruginosa]|uniref:phage major capsid protein, P2 family n=1 Tax=Pseudomonas aeruginosa TaxID=287 RepID=UPI00232D4332|nr:phage major capsid protein, P2 family [Pseudomonas aeruginosa]MDI3655780.1 phage major capsid protein, P2 family [Pseudomonas aeruginosa]MDI3734651.1 phage major capsid protein, P2 family [Pseudomonas aeruginosa]HEJ5827377.1 phage major capsid protein, P2 family [Pseudomonas aeruginosa]HEJ5936479.1 phage major capsid protein, P2 family [Pseudomonas aeruginosa]HEK0120859.1 phage major capsid protein, P2 family [Pseudomonas aeruginosa]
MAALNPRAAAQYQQLQEDLAEAYNVDDTARTFAVEPTHAQELNDQITERVDFLGRINVVPVSEIKGEKVLLGLSGPASSRTDTNKKDREPRSLLDLKNNVYELFHTETDVALKFATIDSWAKFPDFADRYLAAVQKRIALDRILIGWHGIKAAVQTDPAAFPMLEDVNKGWLQLAREQIPEQVMKSTDPAKKIVIGKGGDYANLDAAVHDIKQMVDPVFRDEGDLVAIVGSDLLAYDKGKLYAAQGQTPTEKERIEGAQVIATYGGLASFVVPFFPAKGIVVTSWNNLSIYFQDSSWRRHLLENPRRSQVEDFNGRNEGYVIEQLGKFSALDGDSVELAP